MRPRNRPLFALLLAASWPLIACGASSPASEAPPASNSADEHDEEENSSKGGRHAEVDCSDGSCIACGAGFCPLGSYCEERGDEGTCAWIPECAEKPSCACLLQILGSSCSCSESDGGPRVRCS